MIVYIPDDLAAPSYSPSWDGKKHPKLSQEFIDKLIEWKEYIVTEYGANPKGRIQVNSAYRPAGTTCGGDNGGRIDLTDINGHWTGRAVDISTDKTVMSFWPKVNVQKNLWVRDFLREKYWDLGLCYPWLWRNGHLYEFWHVSWEKEKWAQKNAFRQNPAVRSIPDNYLEVLCSR